MPLHKKKDCNKLCENVMSMDIGSLVASKNDILYLKIADSTMLNLETFDLAPAHLTNFYKVKILGFPVIEDFDTKKVSIGVSSLINYSKNIETIRELNRIPVGNFFKLNNSLNLKIKELETTSICMSFSDNNFPIVHLASDMFVSPIETKSGFIWEYRSQ